MKKIILFSGLLLSFMVFASADKAQAQNSDQCNSTDNPLAIDITDDHEASDGLSLHTCSTTLNGGMSYTFQALGICNGVPDIANGLDNCYTVFNDDVDVDLLNNNNFTPTDGFMPPAGNYTHYFAIADSSFSMKGHFAFVDGGSAATYSSVSVVNGELSFSSGANCRPSGTNMKLSDLAVFDISDYASLANINTTLPVVCDTTPTTDGTLSFEMDNVGLGEQSSYLAIDGHEWTNGSSIDDTADVNVVLLDANAGVAANADAVDSVLFVQEMPDGDDAREITDGENQFEVTFSKTDALNVYYLCKGDTTAVGPFSFTGLAALVNGAATAGTLSTANSLADDCLIVGVTLGEGAFSPEVSISTAN